MNSLTRIMSYDKTKTNQENCNCTDCLDSKVKNQIIKYPSLSENEIEQIIKERYNYKDEKTKKFIKKALRKHGDKYDYSKVVYVKATEKVEIICRVEGHSNFWQTPDSHFHNYGCSYCSGKHQYSTEEFIEESNKIHGIGRYDYSKTKYVNSGTKVIIICHNHDEPYEFSQVANVHLQGHGCKKCQYNKVKMLCEMTKEEFIEKARKIHGNRYDYSKVEYINTETKVIVICSKHGEFLQTPHSHLNGGGCLICSGMKKLTTEEFIEKARKIHGDKYDYSKVEYNGNKTKVIIICPKHGEFKQKPNAHFNGQGCPKCGCEIRVDKNKTTLKEFIKQAKEIHGNKYDYSKVEYVNTETKVIVICPKHGEFKQTPHTHLRGNGCPMCNASVGERKVRVFLEKNDIKFETQKRFNDCRNKKPLPFDFYISQYNLCIEFDGQQHFEPTDFKYNSTNENRLKDFEMLQFRDKIKTNYCKSHNINLLRIRYDENVEEKLIKYFQTHGSLKERTIFDL